VNKLKKRFQNKLIKPLLDFLKQGITPHKLALGVSLGIAVGLIPIIGVTTALCFLIAIPLRINMAVIQLVNYFVYPLQIILIIPLMELGSWMLSINPIPYTLVEMLDMIKTNFSMALSKLWQATLLGMFAWLVVIVSLSIISYWIFKKLFIRVLKSN